MVCTSTLHLLLGCCQVERLLSGFEADGVETEVKAPGFRSSVAVAVANCWRHAGCKTSQDIARHRKTLQNISRWQVLLFACSLFWPHPKARPAVKICHKQSRKQAVNLQSNVAASLVSMIKEHQRTIAAIACQTYPALLRSMWRRKHEQLIWQSLYFKKQNGQPVVTTL